MALPQIARALEATPTTREWLVALLEQALSALKHEPASPSGQIRQFTPEQAIARSAAREDLRRSIEALGGR